MITTMESKAMNFATTAHEGQVRKSDGAPMVTHPIRVADTLRQHLFTEEAVIAGYLHDTVEDTDVTLEDIEREFGTEVRRIVAGNTEDKSKTWKERKQHTVNWIQEAPLDVRALIVADKLDNLKSFINFHREAGEAMWDSFHEGRSEQAWYFTSVAHGMYTPADDITPDVFPAFFHEFEVLVNTFFPPMELDA